MQVDDPPYLPVGTAVSAKYKGAFCEAKVSKVVRVVKCKVTYKMGLGTATVSDEQVKGTLRVGHTVQVKHSERKEYVEATIGKIQDCSQYTVVFDDGDITTLRRTALCLKSGRHFNESETLDQLPLTHPEHFGNPVVGGRRGRRNRQLKEDTSDSEAEDENEPDLEAYMRSVGRVVNIEGSDKKKSKENWFPCLIVSPSIQPAVKINVKDEFLVRSFKDGRYYTVPKKEIIQFHREVSDRIENAALSEAVGKALNYIDKDELPVHWERNALFKTQMVDTDSDYNFTDSSDDEQNEEKDRFVAQLYKFMDDSGTPLNKSPVIANKDVDLHKLFRVVQKSGGYNRVTNKNKWKSVANRLRLPTNQLTFNQVKGVYKKCLFSYEGFHKTLGVTMLNHTRSTKKNRGRSLIRDRDRATPINSPKPEKDDADDADEKAAEAVVVLEKGKQKKAIEAPPPATTTTEKRRSVREIVAAVESSDTSSSSSDATDQSESVASTSRDVGRPRRVEKMPSSTVVVNVGRKVGKVERSSSARAVGEKIEKKEDDEKQTRSKSQSATTPKASTSSGTSTSTSSGSSSDKPSVSEQPRKKVGAIAAAASIAAASAAAAAAATAAEVKQEPSTSSKTAQSKVAAKKASAAAQREEQEKKAARGRKKNSTATSADDKAADSSTTAATSGESSHQHHTVSIGDKLKVYYGPTLESKVTYEAKVLEIDKDPSGLVYLVHYTGWNTRYDEWIAPARIAENLSATTKAKRLKHTVSGGSTGSSASQTSTKTPSTGATVKTPAAASASSSATKRGRGMSITGRSTITETPARSTTPSSITSSSSRTKSPATPATRSASRKTRLDYSRKTRRASAQTDMSNHESESDSEISEDESSEPTRTRSSSAKAEDVVGVPVPEVKETIRTYKKKPVRTTVVAKAVPKEPAALVIKEEDVDKNERPSRRTTRKIIKKSSPEKSTEESDEEAGNQPATATATTSAPPPKGRDFDLNQIRSELKGFSKALKVPTSLENDDDDDDDDDDKEASSSSSSSSSGDDSSSNQPLIKIEDVEVKKELDKPEASGGKTEKKLVKQESSPPPLPPLPAAASSSCFEDVYEFKEPEPFEFETRPIKTTPKRNSKPTRSPDKTGDGIGSPPPPSEASATASERKRTREQAVVKKLDLDDSEIDDKKKKLDEFDKVRQSPSFNIVKSSAGGTAASAAVEKPSASVEHVRKSLEDSFNDDFDDSNDSSTAPIFPNFSDGEEKSPKTCDLFAECSNDDGKKDDDDDLPLRSFRPTMSSDDSDNANFAPVTYQNKKRTTTTSSAAIIGETSGTGKIESTTSSFFLATASSVSTTTTPGSSATTTTTTTTATTTPPPTTATTTTTTTITDIKPKVEIEESPAKSVPSSAASQQQPPPPLSPAKPKVIPEALQEPNMSALKAFSSSLVDKLNEPKDLATKERSTRIVDTILKKFSRMAKSESSSDGSSSDDRMELEPDDAQTEYSSTKIELKTKPAADQVGGGISESGGGSTQGAKKPSATAAAATAAAVSDTDSSDSEQLVIARSDDDDDGDDDDDSQTNSMDMKSHDLKADMSDSNLSSAQIESTNDDSQEEARNFKFDDKSPSPEPKIASSSSPGTDTKHDSEAITAAATAASSTVKEDEPDSHLHSLLLCEETIPRSPAPSTESHSTTLSSSTATTILENQQPQQQQQPQPQQQAQHHHQLSSSSRSAIANAVAIASIKAKSIHGQLVEMPFASAPSSSNNKMLLLNEQPLLKTGTLGSKADIPQHLKQLNRPLPPAPLVMPPLLDRDRDGSTVLENTPPTTPESTISNLSPRGDDPDMSPTTMENESCKESNDAEPEYLRKRRTLHKSSIYNEEDSMMGESSGHMGMKRPRDELNTPAPCRKRRKSARMADGLDMVPSKRGRKPLNRSRHNSDSDEDSEELSLSSSSANLTMTSSAYDRSSRSPRPSKYNFVVEFDPTLDSGQRIAVLQQKLSELRKTYAEVRTELAAVERRRKKIRRREREGKCRRI